MSNPTTETVAIPLHDTAAPAESTAPEANPFRRKALTAPEQPPAPKLRCRHRVRSGAYCRLPATDEKTGLCFRHASLRLQEVDAGDLSQELVCGIKEFDSAVDINHVLGEIYKLLAANKISPRRGAVMAYTCSLLLRTLPAIDDEREPEEPQFILDLPRPKRD